MDPSWCEVHLPCGVNAEELGALMIGEVSFAEEGVHQGDRGISVWVPATQVENARAEIAQFVASLDKERYQIGELEVGVATEESTWRDAWKKYFTVTRITRRLIIVPSWEEYQPGARDLVLHLDPGRAFGTGAHASTKLILGMLQTIADDRLGINSWLDLGTGSGILSIAMTKLFPNAEGTAIDNDEQATSAAAENFARNGIADGRIPLITGTPDMVEGTFDLVVANIQAPVHIQFASDFRRLVKPGGHLLLSGILAEQFKQVVGTFDKQGFRVSSTESDMDKDEWVALHLQPLDE